MPIEGGGEARSEGQASEPHEASPSGQQGRMHVMEGSGQQPSAAESTDGGTPPEQRPPQPQPPVTPFQQRAMLPPSSSTTDSSPEGTLSQRLPTLPGPDGGSNSGSRPCPGPLVTSPPRGGRPPLPPAPPRLPSAALLSGASSISIASPFMQQQISSALASEGSSRWRSNGGFTSTSSSGPPSGAAPADAAAVAAIARAIPAAQAVPLHAAEQAEEEPEPPPPPEVEQAAWQTQMATVAEEGEEEGEAVPTPLPPRAQPEAQERTAMAAAPAPQLAKAQPRPMSAAPQAQQQQTSPARPGISDWGPLPDDVARLPPAQQAAVHAAAAGEAALRRQPPPPPASAAADAEQKQRRRARAAAAAGQPPASGSSRQLATGGSPQTVSSQTVSTKSSSRGGSLSSSGGRSGGSTGRVAGAPPAAGATQQHEPPLPSVAELPSQALAGGPALPGMGQHMQAGASQAGAPPPSPPVKPSTAPAAPLPAARQSAPGSASLQPSPQAQSPLPPMSPQTSRLSQISMQPQSPPGDSPGGLSVWQAPLPPQVGAGGAVPAVPQPGWSQGVPPPGSVPGLASPSQSELLATQQQLLQLHLAAAAAAAEQQWQEQQQAGAWAAALEQQQEQQQQQQQELAAALALHPATAAVLAAADPATRAIIIAALQQQQEQEAAAAAADRQQQQEVAALAAVQQQQTAFLSAQQQQQHQDLLDTQHRAASAAASIDRQQQQELLLAQQQAQALLAVQQHHMQHMQTALLPGQAQTGSFAPFLAGTSPPGLPGPAQHATGAYAPAYPPAMPPQAPPSSITPSQLLRLQQLQQPTSPAQVARQLSQALSGYSVGSEPAGGVSMPLPQHPAQARAGEHPTRHAVLPAGEPPLRYSPSPAPSRSLDGSGGRRAAAAASGAVPRYQRASTREHPPAYQAAAIPQTDPGLSAFAGLGQHRPRIKAVVSSGGRFVQPGAGGRPNGGPVGGLSTAAAISAAAPGSWTYAGGETRLASLPDSCTLLELLAVLSSKKQRAAVVGFLSPGATGAAGVGPAPPVGARGFSPGSAFWSPAAEGTTPAGPLSIAASTKGSSAERLGGQAAGAALTSPASLASAADTLGTSALASAAAAVAAAAGGRASGLQKLCIVRYKMPSEPGLFVDVVDDEDVRLMFEEYADWAAEGSAAGTVGRKLHIFVEWLPQAQAGGASAESADSDLRGAAPGQTHFTSSDSSLEESSPVDQRLPTKVSDLTSNKIEVIPAGDVQLLAHIGGGTFGDTYRGRWHESDVAVKCINPLMIGVQYASRQAWVDFLRDANQMGKLRHGNLCEVYGVVLPHDSDPRLAAPRSRSEPNAPGPAGSGAAPPAAGEAALAAAPPLPGLPAPPESPRQRGGSPPPAGAAMLMQREATLPPVAATLPQPLPGAVANPPAIVMEFVAGRSLGSAIAAGSDLVSGRLARVVYALDTAKALSYLHSRKVAHLDLKSGNVLLGWRDRRPTAKIAGYGLTGRKVSMVRCAAQGVTSSASMLPWTAPEVFRTPEYVTGKADVYSFAVLMFELWTLKKPFEGRDPIELLERVQAGEVVRPALPGTGGEPNVQEPGPGWRELLERCWAEDPEQRPDFSVIEEELRGIAREVKRQQGPPRARPSASTAQAQPPRAAARQALPPGLPRPRSGTNLAGAAAAQDAVAAEPDEVQRAEGLARPGSGFLIRRLPDSGMWEPAAQRLPEDVQPMEAATGRLG